MRIGVVLGTRPEIMKNYAVVKALRAHRTQFVVLHTHQHYDDKMSRCLFEEMGYAPDYVMPGRYQIGMAIDWVRRLIRRLDLDLVIVNGDTAAAVVGALAAVYSDTALAHVEAGLRSFDPHMVEERNRIIVDTAAHYLFTYTQAHAEYLTRIPDRRGRVYCAGNTTVDLIADFADRLVAPRPDLGTYALVTLHRKELTDSRSRLISVFEALNEVASGFDRVIFPIHPRTRQAIQQHGLDPECLSRVTVVEPLSALECLSYEKHARVILTDSGCIQEEAYLFGVPCVTIRENTERIETLPSGANVLTGFNPEVILRCVSEQMTKSSLALPPIYGDPGAGERIVTVLLEHAITKRLDLSSEKGPICAVNLMA